MNEAIREAMTENYGKPLFDENTKTYELYIQDKYINQLKPYLHIIKDCGFEADCDCVYKGTYRYMNGNKWISFKNSNDFYKFILSDGSFVYVHHFIKYNEYAKISMAEVKLGFRSTLYYDMNGARGPNQMGKDMFVFALRNNRMLPANEYFVDHCVAGSTGGNCAEKILGNIDY